ncbi:MAG: beta-propeller fold lactonase family protein [Deltaproteobacteria bacterium]|nr:beta-propeller fold lactonase family protein [Nannocystaceae bacterium]
MLRWTAWKLPLFVFTTQFSMLTAGCGDGPAGQAEGADTTADGSSGMTLGTTVDPSVGEPTTGTGSEGSEDPTDPTDPDSTDSGEEIIAFPGPTKGGPIQTSPDGTRLAVANRGTGELTLFSLPALEQTARIEVGSEPESVAFSPDGNELYVVARGDGAIVRVIDLEGKPSVDTTLDVGAEPGRAALSATGETLWVPMWGEGYVLAVDTQTMSIRAEIATGGSPYAVCSTNDLDLEEVDETIYVTDFYGAAIEGAREATDGAREGRVFTIDGEGTVGEIRLAPLAASGTNGFEATGAYPNQLYACAVNAEQLYVTSVGASPAAFETTTDFHQNLQGLVHRFTLGGDAIGEGPIDLNALVDDLAAPKRFVPVPVDIAFAPNSEFGYIASLTSDSVLRVDFSVDPPVAGSPSGASFLAAGQSPLGIAIAETNAYVVNEVARSVSHIDLAMQVTADADIESGTPASGAAEQEVLRGQRFFNTGLGRWSTNGWVSCAGCHPFGTTDNVTWSFPAGPRQTVDTAATFDAGGGTQRILNWTSIFDEIHDFEINTRNVAGGTGAIVSDTTLNENGTANVAARIDFIGPGGTGNPTNAFNIGSARGAAQTGATPDDWDVIEAYVASLRSPRGATRTIGDAEAGRAVFEAGLCQSCHAGVLWTLSERSYTPAFNPGDGSDVDERTLSLASVGITDLGDVRADQVTSTDPDQLFVLANDANGAPARHTCSVRIVGTFDAEGPGAHGAEEIRQSGTAAQGVDGFNVPSLLGVGRGAPFLHNGAAETLEELLDPNGEFTAHLRAGNQVFAPSAQELADLVAFVQTIDDSTETFAIDPDQDFCPSNVPQ